MGECEDIILSLQTALRQAQLQLTECEQEVSTHQENHQSEKQSLKNRIEEYKQSITEMEMWVLVFELVHLQLAIVACKGVETYINLNFSILFLSGEYLLYNHVVSCGQRHGTNSLSSICMYINSSHNDAIEVYCMILKPVPIKLAWFLQHENETYTSSWWVGRVRDFLIHIDWFPVSSMRTVDFLWVLPEHIKENNVSHRIIVLLCNTQFKSGQSTWTMQFKPCNNRRGHYGSLVEVIRNWEITMTGTVWFEHGVNII